MSTSISPKVTYSMLVGRAVKLHREAKGLHQRDLAQALGISQPAYSKLEQGGSTMSVPQLKRLGMALGLSPGQILNEIEVWIANLASQGVAVTDDKVIPEAAALVGLGILAAVIAMTAVASS